MHAETVLLVRDRKRKIAEFDLLLEQRMRSDEQIEIARREARQNIRAFAAPLAAGQNGDPQAGGFGERCNCLVMLTRQNFCRSHEGRLAAGFDDGRGGEQRDNSLARADVALKEPQHAFGLGKVSVDFSDCARLRRRQRIGQCCNDFLCELAITLAWAACEPLLARADQTERELAGEQLVVSKARPGRRFGHDRARLGRLMQRS